MNVREVVSVEHTTLVFTLEVTAVMEQVDDTEYVAGKVTVILEEEVRPCGK